MPVFIEPIWQTITQNDNGCTAKNRWRNLNVFVVSPDLHRCVVYCSEFTHYAVQKGLRAVGMREAILRNTPVDKALKMTAAALERQINEDKKVRQISLSMDRKF